MEGEADVELVGEAHRPARGDVESAIAHAVVDLEGIGRVDAVRAELGHRDVESVGEGRAAIVERADPLEQAGLAGDHVQFVQRGDGERAAVDGDRPAALALEAVERGADVDVELARVADAGGIVVEAARVVGESGEGAAERGGARADGEVLVARVVGAGGQGQQQEGESDRFPQRDGGGGRVFRAQHRADTGHPARAGVDAAGGVVRPDAAEREDGQARGPARFGELVDSLRGLARRVENRRKDDEIRFRSGRLDGRVHALADDLQAECARIGGLEAARRQVDPVGTGRQRDVGAVVDQEGRCEFCTNLTKRAGLLEQLPRRQQLPQLHARRPARQHRERRAHRIRRIAFRRRDQVQADQLPITPPTGLDALP